MEGERRKLVFLDEAIGNLLIIRLYCLIICIAQLTIMYGFINRAIRLGQVDDTLSIIGFVSIFLPFVLSSVGLLFYTFKIGKGLAKKDVRLINTAFRGLKYYFVMYVVTIIFVFLAFLVGSCS